MYYKFLTFILKVHIALEVTPINAILVKQDIILME